MGTSAQTALDTIGVAFGVGEIYYAANAAMRGVGILLTAVNTGELILINNNARNAIVSCFSTPQEAEAFISHYHNIVMMVNSAVIARDLFTGFYEELRAFRLAYQSKQGQLSGALGANSAEMRALEELNGSIVQEEAALGVAESKLWTQIDEFTSIVQGRFATIYDVRVTYQGDRVRAGMAFNQNGVLELHLNIPPELQGQGIGREIFRNEIADELPNQVKGWWKTSDDPEAFPKSATRINLEKIDLIV